MSEKRALMEEAVWLRERIRLMQNELDGAKLHLKGVNYRIEKLDERQYYLPINESLAENSQGSG